MTKTEQASITILACLEKGTTEKSSIARELMSVDSRFVKFEDARLAVRTVLGANGKKPLEKYASVVDAYNKAIGKELDEYDKAKNRPTVKAGVYIITSAVNNTPAFIPFLNNILAYKEFTNAELLVVAMRYKNPTSIFTDKKDDFWCKEVVPYLDANRHEIHSTVEVMSDVKIQPTTEQPLSGVEGMSGSSSCIFGHPRVHFKYLPVMKGHAKKGMFTTGSVTMPNYTDSKAGKKGEFHHTYGFVIVEVEDDKVAYIHQVTARSDGGFIDRHVEVKDGIVSLAKPPLAIRLGDIHAAKLTVEAIERMTRVISDFAPPVIIMDDVFDGESINPHETLNPILRHSRLIAGDSSLKHELDNAIKFVRGIKRMSDNVVITRSNHDEFLDRYIANMDWRRDLINAATYAELASILLSGRAPKGLFPYLVEKSVSGVRCLDTDESFMVAEVENGNHGHIGSNGSKGSALQFKKLPVKTITAHSHSASRTDGNLVVGCQDLDHEYNKGMSSWTIADVIVNDDGKTQHLLYVNNQYQSLSTTMRNKELKNNGSI